MISVPLLSLRRTWGTATRAWSGSTAATSLELLHRRHPHGRTPPCRYVGLARAEAALKVMRNGEGKPWQRRGNRETLAQIARSYAVSVRMISRL